LIQQRGNVEQLVRLHQQYQRPASVDSEQCSSDDDKVTDSRVRQLRVRVIGHLLYSALLWDEPVADMAHDSKVITQLYLPPTHEPYLPLLHSRRTSLP